MREEAIDATTKMEQQLARRALRNSWAIPDDQMRKIMEQTAEVAEICRQEGDHRNFNGAVRILVGAKKLEMDRELAMMPKEVQHTGKVVLSLPDNGRDTPALPHDEPIVIDAQEVTDEERDGDGVSALERSLPVDEGDV